MTLTDDGCRHKKRDSLGEALSTSRASARGGVRGDKSPRKKRAQRSLRLKRTLRVRTKRAQSAPADAGSSWGNFVPPHPLAR